eukprot:1859827-Karenia_brevis.AAC.1
MNERLYWRTWTNHEKRLRPQGISFGDESVVVKENQHPADWVHATFCLHCDEYIVQRLVCCPRGLCERHMGEGTKTCLACNGV